MVNYKNYSDVIFDAFLLHTKRKEIIDRKQDILTKVSEHYNLQVYNIMKIMIENSIRLLPVTNI